ncbi:MAG TPA: Tm-1-like ATP-binding domain-containing protein, partial [Anditalea sp.]|nr:Tm-1-like ATP-binding domain-containing protein [Anditalea sp.]
MPQRDKYILIIGCFDTKGEEFHFLYNAFLDLGEQVLTINTGIRGTTDLFKVDFEADVVSSEAGESIKNLREKGDRGYAIEKMGLGAASLIAKLVSNVSIKGAIGMGGGGGTYIALSAMQSIP